MEIIALVPMKGQSERVANKNLRSFAGKPLCLAILSTLRDCPCVKKIVVDTDSDAIKSLIAGQFPDVVLIDRPESLRGHRVPMNSLIRHDLSCVSGEHILQTHATNPILSAGTIILAAEEFEKALGEGYDSLFSVNSIQARLYDRDHKPINHDPNELVPTQDLPPIYEENSNLYFFTRQSFGRVGHRIGTRPKVFPMSRLESWDIDIEDDFKIAELLYAKRTTTLRPA